MGAFVGSDAQHGIVERGSMDFLSVLGSDGMMFRVEIEETACKYDRRGREETLSREVPITTVSMPDYLYSCCLLRCP